MYALPRAQTLVVCGILLLVFAALNQSPVQAQLYFTGPYGPGGTWNLYEHRGFLGAERFPAAGSMKTWLEAHQEAISRVEPLSGTNARGHLLALSGQTAQAENDFAAPRLGIDSAWIGLTDNEDFGGGEAGTDGLKGFGHPPGDGVGWKWTSGEVFDYANWYDRNPSESDAAVLDGRADRKWTMFGRSTRPSIIEYETRSTTALTVPALPLPPFLPGPTARPGAFGIREVAHNGLLAPGGRLDYGEIGRALRSLQNISPVATVRDYYTPVIDLVGDNSVSQLQIGTAGPNRPFELLQSGDVDYSQLDEFAMVAHGQILIPEGLGGDWTFQVTSDDGFELYIRGASFKQERGEPFVTHYGSLMSPYDKPSSSVRGDVSLQPGIHDIELVYYENKGYAMVELAAAPGRSSQVGGPPYVLIGAPALNVRGRNPSVPNRFGMKQVRRITSGSGEPTPAEQVKSLADARALLSAPGRNDQVVNSTVSTLNHDNIVGNNYGRYDSDEPFIFGNDVAGMATASLSVATAGTYTFGFYVLDGGALNIAGAEFKESFGEGIITDGGQSLTLDRVTDEGLALAVVDLLPGDYPLEFVTYNRDGQAIAELFVAPGRVEHYDGAAFALLSGDPAFINYSRPAGLQLVPEPATVVSGTIGVVFAVLIAWRRRFC